MNRILFVDDEPNILTAYRRQLRKQFDVHTALGSEKGIEAVTAGEEYAVVVSDLKMPGMDGIEFLSHVRELHPDTVRIMITGFADVEAAVAAVNEGNVFRFLTKPAEEDVLTKSLGAALEQHRLVTAERELLEETLSGSIKAMMDVLSLVNPGAFSRASRLRRYVKHIAVSLGLAGTWRFELAAMLSQIGCVTLPPEILEKVYAGQELSENEQSMFAAHPGVGRELLVSIPRMKPVAEIITHQLDRFDGSDFAQGPADRDTVALGAQMLQVAFSFDRLIARGETPSSAIEELRGQPSGCDPALLLPLDDLDLTLAETTMKAVRISELSTNMVLAQNVVATDGRLLVTKGGEVTFTTLTRLRNWSKGIGVAEPIRVLVPRPPMDEQLVTTKHQEE